MQFNVSTLLGEPVGSTRAYEFEHGEVHVAEHSYRRAVAGYVDTVRTTRGVLVRARIEVTSRLECALCLTAFEQPLELEFDEEFLPERDPESGEPTEGLTADDLRIDDTQHLDLSEAVRQYEGAATPLRPVCRPDCAGLCPHCGQDLNKRACDCRQEARDDRWSGLAALAQRLRSEDDDGRTEA